MRVINENKSLTEDVRYVYEGFRDPLLDELLKELSNAITSEKK